MQNSAGSNWYHTLGSNNQTPSKLFDDDGIAGSSPTTTWTTGDAESGDDWLLAVTWPAGAAALERWHRSAVIRSAGSPTYTHQNSTGNSGGNQAGPGTTGKLRFGNYADIGHATGVLAVVGIWAGQQLSNPQRELHGRTLHLSICLRCIEDGG